MRNLRALAGLVVLACTSGSVAQELGAVDTPSAAGWSAAPDDSKGLFGPFRIGPVVGVGLPNLLNVGVMLKVTRYFGAGVNLGVIPTMRIAYYGDATLAYQSYEAYGRIHPFGGGLFVGSGVGYAHARATHSNRYDISEEAAMYPQLGLPDTVTVDGEGTAQALVLTPQLGYFHIFSSGFSAGADLGVQIPVARSKSSFDRRISVPVPEELAEEYIGPTDRKVRDTLEDIARTPIPSVNLRIGWML